MKKHDAVVAAWAEPAQGPGWANAPLWVLRRSSLGEYRIECIQPSDHTEAMSALYSISALVSGEMRQAVERWDARKE